MTISRSAFGFFAGIAGAATTAIVYTVKGYQGCGTIANKSLELLQMFLDSEIGVAGNLKMNVEVGEGTGAGLPITGNNLTLAIHLNLNGELIEELKTFPIELLRTGCQSEVIKDSAMALLLLMTLTAATTGAKIGWNYYKSLPNANPVPPTQHAEDSSAPLIHPNTNRL